MCLFGFVLCSFLRYAECGLGQCERKGVKCACGGHRGSNQSDKIPV